MKLRKLFFTLLLLLAAFQVYTGQEIPKAELVDEFGEVTCEELIARQDNLINLLENDPTSIGYAVIYGKKDNLRAVWRNKRFLDGQTEFRRFDEQRLIIIRGKEAEQLRIQFWKVPVDAEKPDFGEIAWDFSLSKFKKPFIFSSTDWEVNPCPIGLQLKTYSNYLTANANARGNIVIFAKTKKEFQKDKKKLSDKLTNEYKVPLNQLRFFYKKTKTNYTYHEFWLVPKKQK